VLSKKETVAFALKSAEQGFLCSESVLLALGKCQGVSSDLIPRVATGFGAGFGRMGEVCGAISGAILGLGIRFGRSVVTKQLEARRPYWFTTELLDRFKGRFGSVRCRDLTGLDLSREADVQRYHDQKLWDTRCRDFVRFATELAYDLLRSE
jgi:C_GCAxxG_C_C family probable redox protein